jgi:hypothetical protein
MVGMIGRIQRVPLREVWKHEALDFTAWLEKNFDVLNDALDISLSSAKREQAAGSFSVDLLAEDDSGNFVVIENQLGKSDHDHLGKLLTYLVAFEAKTAIWIVSEPRPEHVSTIAWLNEVSPASFYLLKVEALKIEDSLPAPFLTPVVGPSEEGRRVGDAKKEQTEVHSVRRRFWSRLLEKAAQRTNIHAHASPSDRYYSTVGTGIPGLYYGYVLVRGAARIELYIHRSGGAEENERVFDLLADQREDIEAEYGAPLHWQRNEGSSPCRIYKLIDVPDWTDEDGWDGLHEEMINSMIKLDSAMTPRLKELLA